MPKRHGQLFAQCFTVDALMEAYLRARRGKRKTWSVKNFERDLGANIQALHDEIHDGTYTTRPYRRFNIQERKKRLISAPAFRDVVVQHAIYAVIYPIFDRTFIHHSYGCRSGKGTHSGNDQAQRYLRESPNDSYTLQLDIRKFYYRIDHAILRALIERKIKDRRLLVLLMMFADHGDPVGVPPGNLLVQLYALIYLNSLDHFIKREMRIERYVRYVDDFILFGLSKQEAKAHLATIRGFIAERLRLELSHWTIAPTKRGVNFVGFRTWRCTRFVRKHSLYRFSCSLRAGNIPSLTSILGNARRTGSHTHMQHRLRAERPDLIQQLPRSLKCLFINTCA